MAGRTRFEVTGRQSSPGSNKTWGKVSTKMTYETTSSSEIRIEILNALDGQTFYPKDLFSRISDKWRASYWNVSDALNFLVSQGLISKSSDGFGTLFTTTDEGRDALKDGRLKKSQV